MSRRRTVIPFRKPVRTPPRRRAPRRVRSDMGWGQFALLTFALCAALFTAVLVYGGAPLSSAAVMPGRTDPYRAHFPLCGGGPRVTCVVDGDTIWFRGRKIRIADINTPETGGARCASEAALGNRAKLRLQRLLNMGAFDLETIDRDTDRYGRDLRIVTRGGDSLGAVLVDEGLAEEWQGYRRQWC